MLQRKLHTAMRNLKYLHPNYSTEQDLREATSYVIFYLLKSRNLNDDHYDSGDLNSFFKKELQEGEKFN